jgi:hypothetical protein
MNDSKKWGLLALLLAGSVLQSSCGYLAAGATGAVIGHEVSERNNDDDEENN